MLYIYGPTVLGDLGSFFSFFTYTQSVGLLGRGMSPSQGRYLHTGQHKYRINTQTTMPRVGFEHTTTVFKRAKNLNALDRTANMIGVSTVWIL
jgi:hypothetical protein